MRLSPLAAKTIRRSARCVTALLVSLASTSCASAGVSPGAVSDTVFERSLQVDLAAMTKTPSGLYYKDVREGQGEVATLRQRVTVRYTGWLPNGNKVDSSDGIEFRLNSGTVIEAWVIGIQGMRVGGVRTIVFPPELGYRYRDVGAIPAGSVLVFRIELVRVRE